MDTDTLLLRRCLRTLFFVQLLIDTRGRKQMSHFSFTKSIGTCRCPHATILQPLQMPHMHLNERGCAVLLFRGGIDRCSVVNQQLYNDVA